MTPDTLMRNNVWVEIGRTKTTPIDNEKRKELDVDDFYLVVGFEVSATHAYVNGVFDLGHNEYGHAFFYAVKNNIVISAFSFGPSAEGDIKVGWLDKGEENELYRRGAFIKNGSLNARPGSLEYPITEICQSFKLKLTPSQAFRISVLVDEFKINCESGKKKYTVIFNDTCAEEARDILTEAGVETPDGAGKIKHHGFMKFSMVRAVNPFAWHSKFIAAGHNQIWSNFGNPWVPTVGDTDPIYEHRKHPAITL